jgi:hypothetical protein
MAKPKKSASPATPSAAKPRAKSATKSAPATPAAAAAPAAAPASAKPKPTPEAIGARAHAIWVAEGRPDGKSVDHWLRAERELNGS